MKIAYIHNIAMPGREANTVNVAKMCSAMAALGHEVTLIAADSGRGGDFAMRLQHFYGLEHRFAAVALPGYGVKPTLGAAHGAMTALRSGAQLVWTRAPHAALAACSAGIPTLLELHTDLSAFSALGRHAFQATVKHRNLVCVVVISTALAAYVAEECPHLSGRIIVAHDGADDHFAAPASPRTDATPLSVGYVGSLYRGKGVELIEALASISPDRFTVVGAGGEDRQSRANLTYRPPVSHAEVPALLSKFDVLIAPYQRSVIAADGRTDTARWMSPLKLFEYMAARRPILTSDLPVIREILGNGETALLRAPEDVESWAQALDALRSDNALGSALAERAYRAFRTHHTWTARADTILREVAELRRPSARRQTTRNRPVEETRPPL